MNSITEYLHQIQALTNKNLEILRALNESFYSRKHHTLVNIDGESYTIPSFLTLENKLNSLQANFENLVDAPSTGEAYMTFDGNTQKIQMMGYSQTPHPVDLVSVNQFNVSSNDIFKDFITPNAYVRLEIPEISNCTKNVNIKKISLKSSAAIAAFSGISGSEITYGNCRTLLYNYEEDVDYTEYDTIYRLPLRNQVATGEYVIESVVSQAFNDNFLELYTLKLDTLNYYVDSGTIQRIIQVGDTLVTNNDSAKLEVLAVRPVINEIDIKVLNNAYADLGDRSTGIEDMYKLHYFRSIDFDAAKYVDVPLEEDRYIILFLAPINDTTNIVAPYGNGIVIDTYTLSVTYDNVIYNFQDFYSLFVNNIGDTLFGITSMIDNTINNLTEEEFNTLTSTKPQIDNTNLTVTQINKHLNDSETVKNIRRLYDQKSQYKADLEVVQNDIDVLNTKIATVSFDDTKNSKNLYINKLQELNDKKTNLVTSIASIVNEIAQNVNETDVPIENAKYHIRGFVPIPDDIRKVIKIDVEYRYKNKNRFTGNAETLGENEIFSDWNKMSSIYNVKLPVFQGNRYIFEYEPANDDKNEISWNQIDIPITQGESVDIRLRYIYDYCYPFAETRSDWSDIINIEFPEEFLKNLSVLDIIEENNNDVKNEQLRALLTKEGVIEHVNNKVDDQDVRYFHTPDKIASGFYTNERRIIPLEDKLKSMDDVLGRLETEVLGATSDNLQVTLFTNDYSQILDPFNTNVFNITDYSSNDNKETITGYPVGINFAYEQITIDLYNAGVYEMKFFTSFPGQPGTILGPNRTGCNGILSNVYAYDASKGVFWKTSNTSAELQKENQWIYFRMNSVFSSGDTFYFDQNNPDKPNLYNVDTNTNEYLKTLYSGQCLLANTGTSSYIFQNTPVSNWRFMTAFPIDKQGRNFGIDVRSNNNMDCQCPVGERYITLKPGEHRQVLVGVWYAFNETIQIGDSVDDVTTRMSFDVRTSLYNDPMNYEFTIRATRNPELTSKVQRIQTQLVKTQTQDPYRAVVLGENQKGLNSRGNR